MSMEMRGEVLRSGLRFKESRVAGSVASAKAAKVLQKLSSVSHQSEYKVRNLLHDQVYP